MNRAMSKRLHYSLAQGLMSGSLAMENCDMGRLFFCFGSLYQVIHSPPSTATYYKGQMSVVYLMPPAAALA